MWWTARSAALAAATATVMGAAFVVAAVHDHGAQAAPPAAVTVGAPRTYQPPKVALPAPATKVKVLPRAAERPPAKVAPRTTPSRPKPARAKRVAARPKPRPVHHTVRTSYASALNRAVAHIPTYREGTVRWVVSRAYAFWGTADWYHGVLYVSPDVPRSKLYDVAVHEWSHELSVLDYAGDVAAATRAMNTWFGGSGLVGAERAADCMSILQGATWTHYTTCTNTHWRAGARLLVSGQPL